MAEGRQADDIEGESLCLHRHIQQQAARLARRLRCLVQAVSSFARARYDGVKEAAQEVGVGKGRLTNAAVALVVRALAA